MIHKDYQYTGAALDLAPTGKPYHSIKPALDNLFYSLKLPIAISNLFYRVNLLITKPKVS